VSTHGRGIAHPTREILHGSLQHRMDEIRGEITERLQYERPVGETRMREFEIGLREDSVAVEEQIEIERSRPIPLAAGPALLRLDLEQARQECSRCECRPKTHDRVQVRTLRRTDGIGLVHGRNLDELRPLAVAERIESRAQPGLPIAEIGTDRHVDVFGGAG